jgi:hypothetical protein
MTEQSNRQPARDPQDLERLLIDRQHAGDVDGMVALFEPLAVSIAAAENSCTAMRRSAAPSRKSSRAAASLRAACSSRR